MILAPVAILAVVSHALLASAVPATVDLKDLCANNVKSLSMDTMGSLVKQLLENEDIECPQLVKDALRDFGQIVGASFQDVCSRANVERVQDFYMNYLAHEEDEKQLPKAFERFMFSYAMRMSQRCKTVMVEWLAAGAYQHVTQEDFDMIEPYAGTNSSVQKFVISKLDPGTMVWPDDLVSMIPGLNQVFHKLAIDSDIHNDVQHIKTVCHKRFMPVYVPVVHPVAILARAGFDYPDSKIMEEVQLKQEHQDKLEQWTRIVFLCEMMNLVETFKRDSNSKRPESVEVIDREIFHSIRDQLEPPVDHEGLAWVMPAPDVHIRLGQFEPLPDAEMDELATLMRTHKTPVERFREKMRHGLAESLLAKYVADEEFQSMISCMKRQIDLAMHGDPMPEVEAQSPQIGNGTATEAAGTAQEKPAEDSQERPSAASDGKQLCGRKRKSFAGMFQILVLAAIIAFAMMMAAS